MKIFLQGSSICRSFDKRDQFAGWNFKLGFNEMNFNVLLHGCKLSYVYATYAKMKAEI